MYHCAILAPMVTFAERRITSISRVPLAKREAVEEALEGAVDALLSSALVIGAEDAANCANNERWILDILIFAKAKARLKVRARVRAR